MCKFKAAKLELDCQCWAIIQNFVFNVMKVAWAKSLRPEFSNFVKKILWDK
jgi:hypothetical protein